MNGHAGWILLLAMSAASAVDSRFQTVDSIQEAALSTLPDRNLPGVEAEALVDAALRLPACKEALDAHVTAGGVAEVSCRVAGWRLYVPVRVRRMADVLVLTGAVAAGEILTADKLRVERREVSAVGASALMHSDLALGRVTRRAMPAGAMLSSSDLVAARLIRRGDSVTLIVRREGVEIRAPGRALQDAGLDESLTVENAASRRVLRGVLTSPGEVLLR